MASMRSEGYSVAILYTEKEKNEFLSFVSALK